jgi:hypothetical protein
MAGANLDGIVSFPPLQMLSDAKMTSVYPGCQTHRMQSPESTGTMCTWRTLQLHLGLVPVCQDLLLLGLLPAHRSDQLHVMAVCEPPWHKVPSADAVLWSIRRKRARCTTAHHANCINLAHEASGWTATSCHVRLPYVPLASQSKVMFRPTSTTRMCAFVHACCRKGTPQRR